MSARRNPFPGMDPWLETRWRAFHHSFVIRMADALNERLDAGLTATTETRVVVESAWDVQRTIYPDAHVSERTPVRQQAASAVAELADAPELVRVALEDLEAREIYLQIVEPGGRGRVVTIIEVLSHTNKAARGDGREKYVRKQREVFASDTNLVEIDLIRGGEPTTVAARGAAAAFTEDYHVSVYRAPRRSMVERYRFGVRSPLPAVEVPLRPGEAGILLNLQSSLDYAYERGRFLELLDHESLLNPPLRPDDAAWATSLLGNREATRDS